MVTRRHALRLLLLAPTVLFAIPGRSRAAKAGGLMTYGPSLVDLARMSASG